MRGAPKTSALLSGSKFERLVFVSAVQLQAATGRAEVQRAELAARHIALCEKVYGVSPTHAEHDEIVCSLCCSKLLAVAEASHLLRILVQAEDVQEMAQKTPELGGVAS